MPDNNNPFYNDFDGANASTDATNEQNQELTGSTSGGNTGTNASTQISVAPTAMLTPTQAASGPAPDQLDVTGSNISPASINAAAQESLENYAPGGPPAGINVNGTWIPAGVAETTPSTGATPSPNGSSQPPAAPSSPATGGTTITGYVGEPGTDHFTTVTKEVSDNHPADHATTGSSFGSIPTSSSYKINDPAASGSLADKVHVGHSPSTANKEITGWVGEPGTDHMAPIIATSAETNPTGVKGITR